MPKILFDAVDVRKLLAKHPEIEAELTSNAAAQVAEQFKRKVLNDSGALVERLIAEVNSKLNYKYHLPEAVLNVIRESAADHFKKLAEADAEKLARKSFDAALERYVATLDRRLDGIITTAVEKKVALLLRGLK